MSSAAIMAGLKSGNAMEMATIEEVKAGMNSVLDGMLRECFNRSDGLSELMEKLQLGPASAAATNLTAEQNAQLTRIIKRSIASCERAMVRNDRKEQRDVEIATSAFEAEARTIKVFTNHVKGIIQMWVERNDPMNTITENSNIHDTLIKLHEVERTHIHSAQSPGEVILRDYDARKTSRFQEIASTYKKEQSAFRKQIARLERIAIIAGIDLKATSRNEPTDGVSTPELQAPHLSSVPFPHRVGGRGGRGGAFNQTRGLSGGGMVVGRGGRGSFQSRPTDSHSLIPDSRRVPTMDDLRKLSRGKLNIRGYQG